MFLGHLRMQWVKKTFIFIFCVFFIKNCVFSVYYIPTSSMQPAIATGSYVLVTKYNYRLRTPAYVPFTTIPFPYVSFDGFSEPKRGDVVVFNRPDSIFHSNPSFQKKLIKRVSGIPGDTVKKMATFVKVNKFKFYKPSYYSFLSKQLKIKKISYMIPGKGDTLNIISGAKGKRSLLIFIRDGGTLKDGKQENYSFSQNFYFMTGDNSKSNDSRYWGLVPEKKLIGKAAAVIWPWPHWIE